MKNTNHHLSSHGCQLKQQMSSALSPLLYDTKKSEYYLTLPTPFSHIRITPPRLSDVDVLVEMLNEDAVWPYLSSPPYPYLKEHGQEWIERIHLETINIIDALEKHQRDKPLGTPGFAGGCPVRYLREVKINPDGSEEEFLIGDVGFSRHGFPEIDDRVQADAMTMENMSRAVGDPEIVWMVGGESCSNLSFEADSNHSLGPDFLRTSHQGKGIMTVALRLLLKEWAIPRMGAKKMIGTLYDGNIGSQRVLEKCGFVTRPEKLIDYVEIPPSKGGGRKTLVVMDWDPERLS